VLIVVEDGDVGGLLETAFDLEASRGGDILEVDSAEGRRQELHGPHDLVRVLRVQADGEGIHPCEGLEEHALALHHGHGGFCADVAQTEDGRPVGDDRHQVPTPRVEVDQRGVAMDLAAGLCDPRRVGRGEVVFARHFDPARDLELTSPQGVEPQSLFL
jgi:hypothetical protein